VEVVNVDKAGVQSEGGGRVVDKNAKVPDYLNRDVDFKVFWQAWNIIQTKYIDRPVKETKLFYGALNGMVAALGDPFSTFLEPKTASDFTQELNGHFEGVGMEIGIRNNVLTVISPLPGTPADKAGIRPADVIIEINGESTENMDLAQAVNKIRGPKGTTVKLKIFRQKTGKYLEIPIVRDTIKIVSVKYEVLDAKKYKILGKKKIAWIKITNFNADTAERFRQAVAKLQKDKPDGLIIDLRGDPGGYLETAIQIADEWVKPGQVVVMEKFADGHIKKHFASQAAVLDKYKTVVLVNGGSASASEILSGALQDYKLATLIGEKTFGKGSVQELENLEDGSAIKITIARWLTPKGRIIDKQGIEPDIKVEMTEEDYNKFLDPQLDRAVEFFTGSQAK
jgi:carboxyl-terminal processing protease